MSTHRKVMLEQTALLLQEMEDDGFTLFDVVLINGKKANRHTPAKPTTWDINNGWCDTWAERVADIIGGEAIWLDTLPGYDFDTSHCALSLDRKWYDAESLDGVDDWRQLPIYVNLEKTREEVLKARGDRD